MFVGFEDGGFRGSDAERLELLVLEEMRRRTGRDPVCGGCGRNYNVSVTIDSNEACVRSGNGGDVGNSCWWRCGAVDFDADFRDDEAVDGVLELGLGGNGGECLGSGGRVYSLVVMNWGEEETRVVVGKHRHGWILGRVSEINAISLIGKIFVEVFMNGGKAEGEMVQGKGEFMPVGADGSVVLSFSLLNSNPKDWVYDW